MLVFVDESGSSGFKFAKGSDPVFAIGMVIFANSAAAELTTSTLAALRAKLRHKSEFKFSKSTDDLRDAFFQGVGDCPFTVRALIVRKETVHDHDLRKDRPNFYNNFVRLLMMQDGGCLQRASVRIDGSGSRQFQRSLGSYLRQHLGARIREVRMSDSARDPLMQLADMCIGAITRAERDRQHGDRWKRMIASRIEDISHYG